MGPPGSPGARCDCGAGSACNRAGAFLPEWGLGALKGEQPRARGGLKNSSEGLKEKYPLQVKTPAGPLLCAEAQLGCR